MFSAFTACSPVSTYCLGFRSSSTCALSAGMADRTKSRESSRGALRDYACSPHFFPKTAWSLLREGPVRR